MQALQDPMCGCPILILHVVSNPKSGVDLSFIKDLFNKIASNNHTRTTSYSNGQGFLAPPPTGCAAAGIYLYES
jgi:hypothetical protein